MAVVVSKITEGSSIAQHCTWSTSYLYIIPAHDHAACFRGLMTTRPVTAFKTHSVCFLCEVATPACIWTFWLLIVWCISFDSVDCRQSHIGHHCQSTTKAVQTAGLRCVPFWYVSLSELCAHHSIILWYPYRRLPMCIILIWFRLAFESSYLRYLLGIIISFSPTNNDSSVRFTTAVKDVHDCSSCNKWSLQSCDRATSNDANVSTRPPQVVTTSILPQVVRTKWCQRSFVVCISGSLSTTMCTTLYKDKLRIASDLTSTRSLYYLCLCVLL
jgi:hypothetical protein